MENIIRIDINDKDNITEKYNNSIISNELIEYMIAQVMLFSNKEKIKIVINNSCALDNGYITLIKETIKIEYKKSLNRHRTNNIKEFILVIIGVLFLFISNMISDGIFNELFLIIGWVPVWEAIELELFSDSSERKKRFILKKLLESEIIFID